MAFAPMTGAFAPSTSRKYAVRVEVLAGRLRPDLDEARVLADDGEGGGHDVPGNHGDRQRVLGRHVAWRIHVGELHRVVSGEHPFGAEVGAGRYQPGEPLSILAAKPSRSNGLEDGMTRT